MKRTAIFPILVLLLLAVSIIHRIRRGMDDRSSASAPASPSESVKTASPAPVLAPVPVAAPAVAAPDSVSKVTQSFDAALERIRNDPTLSLLERRQRETELSQLRMQMVQREAAISRLRMPQAETAAAAGAASAPAATPESEPAGADTSPASHLPYGLLIPGRPGFINSPFAAKHQLINIAGMSAGMAVKCPFSGKLFRIPPDTPAPPAAATAPAADPP